MNRLNGDIWGAVLAVVAVLCVFVNRGESPRQRTAHRIFRVLLALNCLNFALACRTEPYRTLQHVAPLVNNLLIRWLIASIFLVPAWPLAETALMRETKTRKK